MALLARGHVPAFVDRAKIAGAMPAIRHQIAMSEAVAGWVIGTAFALGYGATILLMAAIRPKPMRWAWQSPVGLALWACASLMTGFSRSISALLPTRAIVGCGQALFAPAALSLVVADLGSSLGGSLIATAAGCIVVAGLASRLVRPSYQDRCAA